MLGRSDDATTGAAELATAALALSPASITNHESPSNGIIRNALASDASVAVVAVAPPVAAATPVSLSAPSPPTAAPTEPTCVHDAETEEESEEKTLAELFFSPERDSSGFQPAAAATAAAIFTLGSR